MMGFEWDAILKIIEKYSGTGIIISTHNEQVIGEWVVDETCPPICSEIGCNIEEVMHKLLNSVEEHDNILSKTKALWENHKDVQCVINGMIL